MHHLKEELEEELEAEVEVEVEEAAKAQTMQEVEESLQIKDHILMTGKKDNQWQ